MPRPSHLLSTIPAVNSANVTITRLNNVCVRIFQLHTSFKRSINTNRAPARRNIVQWEWLRKNTSNVTQVEPPNQNKNTNLKNLYIRQNLRLSARRASAGLLFDKQLWHYLLLSGLPVNFKISVYVLFYAPRQHFISIFIPPLQHPAPSRLAHTTSRRPLTDHRTTKKDRAWKSVSAFL